MTPRDQTFAIELDLTLGMIAQARGMILLMQLDEYISVLPDVRSGKPCIRGTRITVYDILEYMAGGMSNAEILNDFPELKPEHLQAVLAFAAARERRLSTSPAA